jgi:S-adenosylmethionine hydrolase
MQVVVRGGGEAGRSSRGVTFAAVDEGAFVLLVDSSGWLAVACNGGDAAQRLRVVPGDTIEISRAID